jgi:protease-4
MADVAASGGYYVSCNADRIFADPATLTGSIGVITEHEDFSGLLGKIGVKVESIKSGKLKDMLSPTRPLQPEERQVMTAIITQVYGQFVQAVATGRKLDPGLVRKLADGRVYTGAQAKNLKLIDELGGLQEALASTARLINYEGRPSYRTYGAPGLLRRLLGSTAPSQGAGVQASGGALAGGLLYDDRVARMVGHAVLESLPASR